MRSKVRVYLGGLVFGTYYGAKYGTMCRRARRNDEDRI
jgi:hypothetical protein